MDQFHAEILVLLGAVLALLRGLLMKTGKILTTLLKRQGNEKSQDQSGETKAG